MLKFKQLEIHNYMSFKDAVLPLDNQGLTLIEGVNNSSNTYASNASGKTSLTSGLTYALYGKTVEGVSGDEVINREAGKDCHVFLDFEVDGTPYRIERYRKGAKGKANKVRLYSGETDLTQATSPKTNAAILDLFGISFETYVNTIAYGQGEVPVFSKATDKGKKEILENLANTAVYEEARKEASQKRSEAILEQTRLTTLLSSQKSSKEQLKQFKETMVANNASLKSQKEDTDKRISTLTPKLDNLKEQLSKNENTYNAAMAAYEMEVKHIEIPDMAQAQQNLALLQKKETTLTYEINSLKHDIETYTKMYNDLDVQKLCPTCGQPVTNEHKEQERAKLKDNLVSVATEYKQKLYNLNASKPLLQDAQAEVDNFSQVVQEAMSKKQEAFDKTLQYKQAYTDAKAEYQQALSELTQLQSYTFDFADTALYDTKIEETSKQLRETQVNLDNTNKKVEDYSVLADKVFSRKGIQSMAMDLIVPFLNEHTNMYLARLSGSILKVKINTQTLNANKTLSDTFDLQVENESGANNYQNCSAGEKKRIDIAISFAIQDLQNSKSNMSMNLAIYDECFDGLDAVGAESVVQILKDKQKDIGTIFVITHNESLKPLFDNVLTVEKGHNGLSRIKE